MRTDAFDKTIGQIPITFLTQQLLNSFDVQQALAIQLVEELLNDTENGKEKKRCKSIGHLP